jgi:hypothetical protein
MTKLPRFEEIGYKILAAVGEEACQDAYGTKDAGWIGRYAVAYGDANRDGTLN